MGATVETKATTIVATRYPHLKSSRERSERFEAEIKTAQPAMAKQLIAAWKEIIIENFMDAVRKDIDPQGLATLDSNIALTIELLEP
jgi:hypothetical protein